MDEGTSVKDTTRVGRSSAAENSAITRQAGDPFLLFLFMELKLLSDSALWPVEKGLIWCQEISYE